MTKTVFSYLKVIAVIIAVIFIVSFGYTIVSNFSHLSQAGHALAFGGDAGGSGGSGGDRGGGCCGGGGSSGDGKGGGTPTPIDVCPNISGSQTEIPSGYVKNSAGNCVIDVCPNLNDIQESVPSGYVKNAAGQCVIDTCPNIDGIQETVPSGMVKNSAGQCVTDVCPNIDGIQETVPAGKVKNSAGQCVTDMCPNIDGIQETVPSGMVKNSAGNCVNIPQCTAPAFATNPINLTGVVNVPFSYTIYVATGTPPITLSGEDLPSWLSLNGDIISGTPTTTGVFTFKIQAANSCGSPKLTITVTVGGGACIPGAPTITSNTSASGTVGVPFSYTITTDKAVTEYDAVNLPQGLSIGTTTGIISGTPTETGTFTVTLKAKNQCALAEATLTITVDAPQCTTPAPTITSSLSASGTVGSPFSYTLTATGTVSLLTAQNLPAGLTFNSQTGVISGTPTEAGTFNVTVGASNSCRSDQETLVIVITSGGGGCTLTAPSITSGTSASVTVNQPFSYTITTSGTIDSLTVTSLPNWLNYSTTSQVIFGTPGVVGEYHVTIHATNQCAFTDADLVITVVNAPGCTVNCGGGGFFSPTVVLTRASSTPLASFASIYLSQVPYTGVGDTLVTALFLIALLGVSVSAAYFLVYRESPLRFLASRFSGFFNREQKVTHDLNQAVTPLQPQPVLEPERRPSYSAADTYREVKTFVSQGISDAISEGLSSIKESLEKKGETQTVSTSLSHGADASNVSLKRELQDISRSQNIMIGDEGIELILIAADNKRENAVRIIEQIILVAREWYQIDERSSLLLDTKKIRSILFSTYISMVPLFIRWIAENNEQKVFNFIRMLNTQGHAVSDFLKAVAFELDRVYRFRTEHEKGADEYALESTFSWKKEILEQVISILVGAFDGSYSSPSVSGKLALSKVFDVVGKSRVGNGARTEERV